MREQRFGPCACGAEHLDACPWHPTNIKRTIRATLARCRERALRLSPPEQRELPLVEAA